MYDGQILEIRRVLKKDYNLHDKNIYFVDNY